MNYLIESALLVHGIRDLDDELILHYWGSESGQIVWMEKGEIVIGDIRQLLDFRNRCRDEGVIPRRANHYNLDKYAEIGADSVLTASGAMSVCARAADGTLTVKGVQTGGRYAAVTAGIGGFFPGLLEENDSHLWTKGDGPPDVATLTSLNVVLVSSGPKDMLDYAGTIRFLDEHGVKVLGVSRDVFSGYIFIGEEAKLPGVLEGARADHDDLSKDASQESVLIINEIAEEKRISDRGMLDEAVSYALEEEKKGGYYHPAVNAKIEELTHGYSACLQLAALIENAQIAAKLDDSGF